MSNAMNRRNYLMALAAVIPAANMAKAAAAPPIQLHCDLFLDPKREKEMLDNYHKTFLPAIGKQPGFVSVSLLKLKKENQGKAPKGASRPHDRSRGASSDRMIPATVPAMLGLERGRDHCND